MAAHTAVQGSSAARTRTGATAAALVPIRLRALVAVLAVFAVLLTALPGRASGTRAPAGRLLLQVDPSAVTQVADRVQQLGGRLLARLGSVGVLVVSAPPAAAAALAAEPGVRGVTPDTSVHLLSDTLTTPLTAEQASSLPGSLQHVTALTGARDAWRHGVTGRGVDVAVIDSGVAPVPGLSGSDKVVVGPDLSFASQAAGHYGLDGYGHGTHMAGIIAGRDAPASGPAYAADSQSFLGMAPDARLVSVRVGDDRGATDVSQVIAAIDWVVAHRNDAGLNIRVLNLSFGTNSAQDWRSDPLSYAAEQAWRHGIVVVAAAGNAGYTKRNRAPGLADPAYNPTLLAVGAVDTKGTATTRDDMVPSFSSGGTAGRDPDLLAPGKSVVSLRDPGSAIDVRFGDEATVADRFFLGSGTSQATAVVSGAAALLLSARPALTPDQVKALLTSTAAPIKGVKAAVGGSGELDLSAALHAPVPETTGGQPGATGGGSLDAARGSARLSLNGVALTGEEDIFGRPVDTGRLAALEAAGSAWAGGVWNGSTWAGSTWAGSTWAGSTWAGSTWAGSTWAGSTWATGVWTGSAWAGSTWAGSAWAGSAWADGAWAGATWS